MDTLELAFQDSGLPTRILARTTEYRLPERYRDKDDGKVQKRRQGYRDQHYIEPDGKSFYMALDRWHSGYPEAIIQIHLSQFETYSDVLVWLEAIMGDDFAQVFTAEVKRLDTCVDLSTPFITVRQIISQTRGRRCTDYSSSQGGPETLYLGAQPRQTCIYQKQLSRNALDDIAASSDSTLIIGTRIEVRHTKGMLPIKTLSDLAKLQGINPFGHLRLSKLDETVIDTVDSEIPIHFKAYLYDRDRYGAHAAKKIHNKSRNYSTTIGRYLGPVELDLAQAWQRRLDRFFSGRLDMTIPASAQSGAAQ